MGVAAGLVVGSGSNMGGSGFKHGLPLRSSSALERVLDGDCPDLPEVAGMVVAELCEQRLFLHGKIAGYTREMTRVAGREERVALLGGGPITASAFVATVGTGKQFSNGREFAAWLGLTPLNRSSGGKERLGRISKMGDQYIRRLLVIGMMSRMRQIIQNPERHDPWVAGILARKPGKVAAVVMANKTNEVMEHCQP